MKSSKKKTLNQATQEAEFKSSDAKEAAGMTYRQLHNWDSKGAAGSTNREDEEKWRKWSAREFFALLVCAEIRKQFGVPLESLKWVNSFMLQEGANHFRVAVELMSLGLSVCLMTDLKETFIFDSDLEFLDLMELGYFRHDNPQAYLFIKVNPLVNKLLNCLKEPVQLKVKTDFYHRLYDAKEVTAKLKNPALSKQEDNLLKLIRENLCRKVVVQTKNGEVISLSIEEELSPEALEKQEAAIVEALKERAYQTVTAVKRDGKIVRISRTTPVKFD